MTRSAPAAMPRPASTPSISTYLRERVPAAFARAAEGVDRVAQIVRSMGEQTHPAAHAPADLNAVARSALALAGGEADLEPLPAVLCDGGAIEQVLVNLLTTPATRAAT